MNRIIWSMTTRNSHLGTLDGIHITTVHRSQKNKPGGGKCDWRIDTLHDPHSWSQTFCHHDPSDLDSTKSAAEDRVKHAIDALYRALHARTTKAKP